MKKPFRAKAPSGRVLPDRESRQKGQATVEYVLMLAMAVSVISVFTVGMRRTTVTLWATLIGEITAACPGCPIKDAYKPR